MIFRDDMTAEECEDVVESKRRTEGKPCDGTWQDYHRHRRRGERPCAASLAAHREYVRLVRQNKERGKK